MFNRFAMLIARLTDYLMAHKLSQTYHDWSSTTDEWTGEHGPIRLHVESWTTWSEDYEDGFDNMRRVLSLWGRTVVTIEATQIPLDESDSSKVNWKYVPAFCLRHPKIAYQKFMHNRARARRFKR